MEPADSLALALLAVALALWVLRPFFAWRDSSSRSLESHVKRTTFQCAPGELVPPAWQAPRLTLSVIVPARNEERRLTQMLEETLAYLEGRASGMAGFSYEVIVVDDGSTDGTYSAALNARRMVRLGELRALQLTGHYGTGFAARMGALLAQGQLLLVADADGSTSVREVERLEQALACRDVHVAFGSRCHLKAEVLARRSLLENLLAAGQQLLARLLVGAALRDAQCGFKLFRADVGKHLFASLHTFGAAFDLELLLLARMTGRRVAEVPVTWVEMDGGKSSAALRLLAGARDVLLLRALYFLGLWQPLMVA